MDTESIAVAIADIALPALVTVSTLIVSIFRAVVPFLDSFTVSVSPLVTPIWKSTAAVVFNRFTPLNLELLVTRLISVRS
ncbi:hypothetical protein D3C72_2196790 [compost metagenome]